MIGLIMGGLFGSIIRSLLAGPMMILTCIIAAFAICGCVRCMHCRIRDFACCKRCLRCVGHDEFDDFDLMMVVHEAHFDKRETKLTTVVQVTAGQHSVQTDTNSNGIFQQPLHITVEQGTENVVVDLMDSHSRVLSTLVLRTVKDVLKSHHSPEHVYSMVQKSKGIHHPKIKLTMAVQDDEDVEKGLLTGMSSDVDGLVRLQLRKAREGMQHGEKLSEVEILKQACGGPLELFEGLGNTTHVYAAVVGPPTSRRWMFGIWKDKCDFDNKRPAMMEMDLLRVQSVQADPTRHHVFVVNYFDESRVRQTLTFRRIDRARDVWVEIIHLLVQRVHDNRRAKQDSKSLPEKAMKTQKRNRIFG